jgi:hypothetical protein
MNTGKVDRGVALGIPLRFSAIAYYPDFVKIGHRKDGKQSSGAGSEGDVTIVLDRSGRGVKVHILALLVDVTKQIHFNSKLHLRSQRLRRG